MFQFFRKLNGFYLTFERGVDIPRILLAKKSFTKILEVNFRVRDTIGNVNPIFGGITKVL